ncbi:MAG TPA: Fe-S cluster assembly protein SufD [Trinickia sp.]|uniref:Fe-S cluster assembly protein SufD n=1 Tax=Trinickia sp. TaxID=2571163 RepID=UPI002F3F021A
MSDLTVDRYHHAFRTLARTLPGAELPWLRGARRSAFERFDKLRFPTTRQEDWKYTNVASIGAREWHFASPRGDVDVSAIVDDLILDKSVHRLVFVNGRHAPRLSRTSGLPEGIFIGSLTRALREIPEQLEALLAHHTPHDGFEALNTAFLSDGYVLVLPPDCRLDAPIQMLFVAEEAGLAIHPFNVVIAGRGARCTVIEQFVGVADDSYLTNTVTRIVVKEGADVEHCRIQQDARRAYHIGRLALDQERASHVASHSFALGAALSRVEIDTRLMGTDADCTLNGLYFALARQHVDHHTCIDHESARCTSREFYRGVLDGAAHGVFNGRVIVHQDAQKTDAHQSNRNLLLSRDAEIDTKPQLEIYADDVKCTHGATVGKLDEAQLFYLRARGIDEPQARATLIWAFARDIVDRVSDENVRGRLAKMLLARMPDGERIQRELA